MMEQHEETHDAHQDESHDAHATHGHGDGHGGHSGGYNSEKDSIPKSPDPWYFNSRACAMTMTLLWTTSIGVAVAIFWFIPTAFLGWAQDKKYEFYDDILEKKGLGSMVGFMVLVAIVFAGISSGICWYFGRCIGGSGLPQLISYLKCGYLMEPHLMTIKTTLLKNFAMTCTVLAGLSVGREGPAIQMGAAVALHVGRLVRHVVEYVIAQKSWMHECVKELNAGDFRKPYSGEYEHEMMIIGAACGFACAFNAPLGGFLFVYEEVATHWLQHAELSSRVFFAVAVAIFCQHFFFHVLKNDYQAKFEGVVVYDVQTESIDESWLYADLPFFILCALFVGNFVGLMQRACLFFHIGYRKFGEDRLLQRFIATILVAILTAVLLGFAPALLTECKPMPSAAQLKALTGKRRFVTYGTCEEGQYNEMATLTLGGGEDMIKHAFSRDHHTFSLDVLVYFFFLYAGTFTLNTGSLMPAGNFVPNVIMGGIAGRIFGQLAHLVYSGTGTKYSNPGVYAIIGATCQLSAWTRTLPAVVVIMFEVSSDSSLSIPMLLISTLARTMATLYGVDGWAHVLVHAPHLHLPHHSVPPSEWIDQKFMDPRDVVSHPKGAAHHGLSKGPKPMSPVLAPVTALEQQTNPIALLNATSKKVGVKEIADNL